MIAPTGDIEDCYDVVVAVRPIGKPLSARCARSGAPRGGSAPRSEHVLGYASRVWPQGDAQQYLGFAVWIFRTGDQ